MKIEQQVPIPPGVLRHGEARNVQPPDPSTVRPPRAYSPRISPAASELTGNPLLRLNARQQAFARHVAKGVPIKTSMRLAGYADVRTGDQTLVFNKPEVQAAIRYLNQKYEAAAQMSRKRVMEGFLTAIEQARMQADPGVQIAGWREIGKMCGYYAPEVKQVNVNVTTSRLVGQLETMTDAELLSLAEKDREVIEAEALHLVEQAPEDSV